MSTAERETLQRWARRHGSAQALALRSRIVLGCGEGRIDRDIAAAVGAHPTTVSKWRHRFATDRLDGLVDAPRPGAARRIGDDVIEAIVVDTLETTPGHDTHWSTRGLPNKHGISHDPAGVGAENIRNGTRSKTVITDACGPVEIDVPRDRAGTFEPRIVKKRQRHLGGVDEIVLSLYSKGLSTGEISAHFAEIYGASVSKETISRITDWVVEEMQSWQTRPLERCTRRCS